jgi:hypothetical protein
MIPSLFIGVPKTATMSICEALKPHGLQEFNFTTGVPPNHIIVTAPAEHCKTFHHAHIPTLVADGSIHPDCINQWFKFAFIRNPWDRMVSLYHYLFEVRGIHREAEPDVKTFSDFVMRVTSEPIPPPGAYNWKGLSQANPQSKWLIYERGPQVDFMGRFERLQKDWDHVCGQLDIPCETLPHVGATDRRPYQEYYTPRLAERVDDFYAVDAILGPYDFEKGLLD